MIWLRSLIFTLSFYALALFGCGIGFFIASPSRRKAWILKFIEANGWCEKRILGLSYEIRGKTPETACLIAGGHQSLWECLKICSLYPGVKFILKRELVEMPLVGKCIRAFEHIPIDRRGGNKSLRQMIRQSENALKQGYSVLIFPQGTRVAPGDVSPYLGGIGMLYERLKVPVVPMVVNSGVFWPRHPLKTKRPGKAVIEFLPPIKVGLSRDEFLLRLETILEENQRRLLSETPLLQDRDRLQFEYRK